MKKYKLHSNEVRRFNNWWVFPLAVQIHPNNPWYTEKNLEITVDFLCFHVRWLFLEVKE